MELLLVIAIIGIMATAGFVSLSSNQTNTKLQAAQREVASVIKLTQSYALQGKVADDKIGHMVTPCGYGFRFIDSTHYEIFYNTWTTGGAGYYTDCTKMNTDFNNRHWKNGTPHSQTMESYQLNNGVTLSVTDQATGMYAEFYFTIPDGNIYDSSGATYGGQTLTFNLSGSTKAIRINPGGSVTENPSHPAP